MSTPALQQQPKPTQRRSQRILLRMAVMISGTRTDGRSFTESTYTLTVNAHGALIALGNPVAAGVLLTIQNTKSGDRLECRVVDTNPSSEHGNEVGVAFLEPSPRFWHVAFPPEDWSTRSPEAKRFDPNAHRPLRLRKA